jgi:hypothetical protein
MVRFRWSWHLVLTSLSAQVETAKNATATAIAHTASCRAALSSGQVKLDTSRADPLCLVLAATP